MKRIHKWLTQFKKSWIDHDIDSVLILFTSKVEYWETPFKKLNNLKELRSEWEGIESQSDIELEFRVFSKEDEKYSVIWDLRYKDRYDNDRYCKGTYLLKLNSENKCYYFLHCCEVEN